MAETWLYKVYKPTNGIQETIINEDKIAKFPTRIQALEALTLVCLGCANNKNILSRLNPSCSHCTALKIEGEKDDYSVILPIVHNVNRKQKNDFEAKAKCGMKIIFMNKPRD